MISIFRTGFPFARCPAIGPAYGASLRSMSIINAPTKKVAENAYGERRTPRDARPGGRIAP